LQLPFLTLTNSYSRYIYIYIYIYIYRYVYIYIYMHLSSNQSIHQSIYIKERESASRALFLAGWKRQVRPPGILIHCIPFFTCTMILVFYTGAATSLPHAHQFVPSASRALLLAGWQRKGRVACKLVHSISIVARMIIFVLSILKGALQLLSNRHMLIRFAHVHARVLLLRVVELLTAITSDLPMQLGRTRNKRLTSQN